MKERDIITINDENGKKIEVEVIAYFELELNHKHYLAYTDDIDSDEEEIEIMVSEVVEVADNQIELEGVDDIEVRAEIDKVLDDILDDYDYEDEFEFDDLVVARRSVRKYKEGEVDEDDLHYMIACALMAPTWKNSETGRYYAALSKEAIKEVYDSLPDFNQNSSKNASYIIATYKKGISGGGSAEGDLWGAYDLGLQNAYLLLKASELGYDTLIMGLRDVDRIRKYFDIPVDEEILSVIAIGIGDEEKRIKPRKEVREVLKIK